MCSSISKCVYVTLLTSQAITKEFDSRYIDGSLENHGRYQLDVDLNTVAFSHHHLFSKEHVLSNRLERMCREYRERGRRNITEYLSEKVSRCRSKENEVMSKYMYRIVRLKKRICAH